MQIHEHNFFTRILDDVSSGKLESFAFIIQLENENFQTKLMQYVEKKQPIVQNALHNKPHDIEQSLADIKRGFKIFSKFLFKLGVDKDNVLVSVCKMAIQWP